MLKPLPKASFHKETLQENATNVKVDVVIPIPSPCIEFKYAGPSRYIFFHKSKDTKRKRYSSAGIFRNGSSNYLNFVIVAQEYIYIKSILFCSFSPRSRIKEINLSGPLIRLQNLKLAAAVEKPQRDAIFLGRIVLR